MSPAFQDALRGMDLAARRHYVAGAMELLLILSALLSTLSGALTSPFGLEAGSRHETALEAVAVAEAAVEAATSRVAPPALRPLDPQRTDHAYPSPAASPVAATPIETDRLIE